MTELDNLTKELAAQEELFDAVRRHICQILGFDFGFIDSVNEHEIVNVSSFTTEESSSEIRAIVNSLQDEYKQPLTQANTHLAQKARQGQKAWIGKAFNRSTASNQTILQESYPYIIVPILEEISNTNKNPVTKGLIRVVSFDASKEVSEEDLSTLRLMGEHLFNKLQFSSESQSTAPSAGTNAESVLVIHSNRVVRRRFSRILGSHHRILEAENSEKALEAISTNNIDLILLDSHLTDTSGYAFCKVLKESSNSQKIPLILITPENDPTSRAEGLNVGADDCLSESCFDAELLARVNSFLKHRRAEKELVVQLGLLEDYSHRLEQATEKLSKEKQIQLQQSQRADILRWETEVLRNQEALLHRISNTIRRSFNIEENLQDMLEELSGYFNLDCCFVVLPTPDEPEDSVRCQYASEEYYEVQTFDIDLKLLNLFRKHHRSQEPLIVNDVATDRRLDPYKTEALTRHHVLSLFIVPISYEERLLGILTGFRCESEARWTKDNESFLKSVADQVAIGVTNARLYAKVQRQATTDGLTGLLNHRTGQEKLTEQLRLAERYQRNISVIMLDVDHFKSINDKHGHPAGDSVLRSVAKLIQRNCRDVDLPVRYGGEEFLLILPEINLENAVIVAERIRKNLVQEIIEHEDIQISVTASLGVASFPDDAQNQQQLLHLADKSLYHSKNHGRNQVNTTASLLSDSLTPSQSTDTASDTNELENKFTPPQVSHSATVKEELVPEVVEMVKAMATTLYSKSNYNKVHHLETARMSEALAQIVGLSQHEVEQVRVAGLLHDVGTLSLPTDLLDKTEQLTKEERTIINQHPTLGADMLRPIRALKDICEILENHHEKWDGTGYPRGLKGEEIPLPARIVSIVDSYHAMISNRPYRAALTTSQAIEALKHGAGLQWDPFLVDIFIKMLMVENPLTVN